MERSLLSRTPVGTHYLTLVSETLSPATLPAMSDDLLARVERLEAIEAIRHLAVHYAQAVDQRDLDSLMDLFVEDVDAGRWGQGRDALRAFYDHTLHSFSSSMHFVGNHVIEIDDTDHAHGAVYCRADHQAPDHWFLAALLYTDEYVRRGGRWYFRRRRLRTWFMDQIGLDDSPLERQVDDRRVPHSDWPTWASFWEGSTAPTSP
jgi:ketosteroid isomerase-like protein